MVAKGQFVIKKLVDTPCVLVEDHLTLPEDTDQLKSPPHFPVPLSRITVVFHYCETDDIQQSK